MIESKFSKKKIERKEAVEKAFPILSLLPSLYEYVLYKKGKMCGADWHQDTFAIFGTVIIIPQYTPNGRIYIEDTNLPEALHAGDIICIDLLMSHSFPFYRRLSEQICKDNGVLMHFNDESALCMNTVHVVRNASKTLIVLYPTRCAPRGVYTWLGTALSVE